MYIITSVKQNHIIMMGESLDYLDNGYPVLLEENISFIPNEVVVNEVENIPVDIEPYKHCYAEEKGFYPNPDYVEPKPYTQEQYDAVIESLITEGVL